MKRAVVLAPHPDDETLGCGGTIAKKLKEGYEFYVVFLTDGRYALEEVGIKSDVSPAKMKDMRMEDALRAAKILGLHDNDLFFLGIEDKTLHKHKSYARESIIKILKELTPTEIYFPQRKEYNMDHRITHIIVKESLRKFKCKIIKYQYAIAWTFPFYLFKHVLTESSFNFMMCHLLKCHLFCVNISEFLSIKKKAIEAYKSQLSLFSSKQNRPVLKPSFVSHFLKNEEKFFVEK